MHPKLITGVIIVSAVVLAFASVWNDSPIVDEIPHIGAGYSYVQKGDFRLNPEHPPLAKDLAGIALSFLTINQSAFQTQHWLNEINGQWNFGRNLIFNSGNDAILMARVAKMPMLLFFIFSAIIIFHWARKIYGDKAGLLAVFLFSFSPTVLAHSRFVTTDIPALFGILLGTYFFVRFLENQTKTNFVLAFVAFGIAQLTKFSLFLLNPLFIILAIGWGLANSKRDGSEIQGKANSVIKTLFLTAMIIVLGYVTIVSPIYSLHTINYPKIRQKADTIYLLNSYGNKTYSEKVIWASDKPFLRPLAQYGLGLLMVTQRNIGGNTTYFLGEIKGVAWKKYFPVVYFIKEPLAFWGLVAMALLSWTILLRPNRYKAKHWIKNHFSEFAMFVWLIIYWYASITANINIGVRHLMPIYGFVFILLSGQLIDISKKINKKFLLTAYHLLLTIFLGWYLFENLKIFPHYLTYFNQTALFRPSWVSEGQVGGGHLYVVDSNIDWGQDAKRLADWVDKNNISKISLDYFGWSDAGYYLKNKYVWINAGKYKNSREFLADNPDGGYIAVSKSFFMGSRENSEKSYAWLDSYKPVADIGNSIFVWYITQ